MAELANAIAEVFAAFLRAIGYVGRPRKRAAIRDDLALLRELDEFPGGEFGPGTVAHIWLVGQIYEQIGEFVGLDLATEKRKASLWSVLIAAGLAAGLGGAGYYLISHGYGWWAVFPITFATLMTISAISLFTEKEPVYAEGNLSESANGETEDLAELTDIPDLDDEAENG